MIDEAYLVRVLGELVKKTVDEKIRPSGFAVGVVSSVSPLRVKLSNDLELPEQVLIAGDQFGAFTLETTDGRHTVSYDNSLKTGDRVRLLKNTGGQQYYIIGRVT